MKTYPRKKRIDRYGLRLEQVQRVVAICIEAGMCQTVKNKNVANISRHLGSERRDFFRKPPAFHRLLFMPPFAGDIGARVGSLKWTAQIPRKAHRWSLRGDLKNGVLALNVKDQEVEELFLVSTQNTNS